MMSRMLWINLVVLALASGGWVSGARAQSNADPDSYKHPLVPPRSSETSEWIQPTGVEAGDAIEISVGEKAPDFTLENSRGRWVGLAGLEGHWAVMVFTEHAETLAPLGQIDGELRNLGARLVCLSPDRPGDLEVLAERQRIPFTLLSDPSRQVARLYDRYDPDVETILPGIVLLDPKGVVRRMQAGAFDRPGDVLRLAQQVVVGP